MSTTFTDDPLASDSEQFGLARPLDARLPGEPASPVVVCPWGLRGMTAGAVRAPRSPTFVYCHTQQVASDASGRPLILTEAADATADSVTDGDGDESRSEDWTYDFVPDNPQPT